MRVNRHDLRRNCQTLREQNHRRYRDEDEDPLAAACGILRACAITSIGCFLGWALVKLCEVTTWTW